jgi:hypothetical protein
MIHHLSLSLDTKLNPLPLSKLQTTYKETKMKYARKWTIKQNSILATYQNHLSLSLKEQNNKKGAWFEEKL